MARQECLKQRGRAPKRSLAGFWGVCVCVCVKQVACTELLFLESPSCLRRALNSLPCVKIPDIPWQAITLEKRILDYHTLHKLFCVQFNISWKVLFALTCLSVRPSTRAEQKNTGDGHLVTLTEKIDWSHQRLEDKMSFKKAMV